MGISIRRMITGHTLSVSQGTPQEGNFILAWDPSELGEDLPQSQEWAIIWAITKNYPL